MAPGGDSGALLLCGLCILAVQTTTGVLGNSIAGDAFRPVVIESNVADHQAGGAADDKSPKATSTSRQHTCSLDDYAAAMTLADLEAVMERFAKLQGMTITGLVKHLYSSLSPSPRRKVLGRENLSPLTLEAIQELCLEGRGPAYFVSGVSGASRGPGLPGGSSVFLPNTEFALLPPLRTLRPPPGARLVVIPGSANDVLLPETSITVSPQMSVVEALRRADYKFAADTGAGDGVLQLGYSATRACYVVEAVAGIRASAERAWNIEVTDRFGKLVFDGVCIPGREEVVVHPRMTITLSYTDVKKTAQ